jgi:hypothetical protein
MELFLELEIIIGDGSNWMVSDDFHKDKKDIADDLHNNPNKSWTF